MVKMLEYFPILGQIFSQVEPLAARELTDCLPDADPSPNIVGGQEVAFGSGLDTVPGGEEFRNRWVVIFIVMETWQHNCGSVVTVF